MIYERPELETRERELIESIPLKISEAGMSISKLPVSWGVMRWEVRKPSCKGVVEVSLYGVKWGPGSRTVIGFGIDLKPSHRGVGNPKASLEETFSSEIEIERVAKRVWKMLDRDHKAIEEQEEHSNTVEKMYRMRKMNHKEVKKMKGEGFIGVTDDPGRFLALPVSFSLDQALEFVKWCKHNEVNPIGDDDDDV